MNNLRTFEQVFLEDAVTPIYVVAAFSEWKHYSPTDCPAPIREWVEQNYPDVVIERLSGFACKYPSPVNGNNPPNFSIEHLPHPMFRLGFTLEQAAHFQEAWNSQPLDDPDLPDNFYFLIL